MSSFVSPNAIDTYLHTIVKRRPQSVPDIISIELLSPLEEVVRLIAKTADGNLQDENNRRSHQGQYQLKHPRSKDWSDAAKEVRDYLTKCTQMYNRSHSFGIIGGGQQGERDRSKEPSESNSPYGGE